MDKIVIISMMEGAVRSAPTSCRREGQSHIGRHQSLFVALPDRD